MHNHLTPHTAAYRTARHISLPLLCKLRQVLSRCETLIDVISNICNGIRASESIQNLDHGSSEEIQEHDIHDISGADIFWERSVGLNIIRLFEWRNSGVRGVVSACPEIIGRGIPRSILGSMKPGAMSRKHTLHWNAPITRKTFRKHWVFYHNALRRLKAWVRTDFIMIVVVKISTRDLKSRLEEFLSVSKL